MMRSARRGVAKNARVAPGALALLEEFADGQLVVVDLVQKLAGDAPLLAEPLEPVDADAALRATETRVRAQEILVGLLLRRVELVQLLLELELEPVLRRRQPQVARSVQSAHPRRPRCFLVLRRRRRGRYLRRARVYHVVPVLREHGGVALLLRRRAQEILRDAVGEGAPGHGHELRFRCAGLTGRRRFGQRVRLVAPGAPELEMRPLRHADAALVLGRRHEHDVVEPDLPLGPPIDRLPTVVPPLARGEGLVGRGVLPGRPARPVHALARALQGALQSRHAHDRRLPLLVLEGLRRLALSNGDLLRVLDHARVARLRHEGAQRRPQGASQQHVAIPRHDETRVLEHPVPVLRVVEQILRLGDPEHAQVGVALQHDAPARLLLGAPVALQPELALEQIEEHGLARLRRDVELEPVELVEAPTEDAGHGFFLTQRGYKNYAYGLGPVVG